MKTKYILPLPPPGAEGEPSGLLTEHSKIFRRIKGTFVLFAVLFLLLLSSTAKAMLFYDEEELSLLSTQYYADVHIYYPRGKILDREGIALNFELATIASQPLPSYTARICPNLLGEVQIDETNTTSSGFQALSGLEKRYDAVLSGGEPVIFSAQVDGAGSVVEETDLLVSGDHANRGGDVVTTLDYHLQSLAQQKVDSLLASKEYEGASIIISKTGTGEILAMASSSQSMLNDNLCAFAPASLAKTYVLAAALEAGLVDESSTFVCTGKKTIGGVVRHCHREGGHGKQRLIEAYANSCNLAFYELASLLSSPGAGGTGGNKYLAALSSLQKDFAACLDPLLLYEEYDCHIPTEIFNELDIFNYALGQGSLKLTPLFINFTTDLIASDGAAVMPHVAKQVLGPDGSVLEAEQRDVLGGKLSKKTVQTLQKAMAAVGEGGTAAGFDGAAYGGFAGKTGTAETVTSEGGPIEPSTLNGWFSGYFPKEDPAYTMTILVRGAPSSRVAVEVFHELAEKIFALR